MLTQLNTYEGVPVGSNNFEDFLKYIRSFLGANFGFSTNVLANNGGYFDDDNFVFSTFGSAAVSNTQMHAFLPQTKALGSLFGEFNEEYYRFEVLGPASATPQVYQWELLPSHADEVNGYTFYNTDFLNTMLPYNPIRLTDDSASRGYNYISYNGVYQDGTKYSSNFPSTSSGGFREQQLVIEEINVGAESPTPISKDGRFFGDLAYDPTNSVLISNGGITKDALELEFDSRLAFPYTNFSLGGHIILTRTVSSNTRYVYVPEDISVGEGVSAGSYKVVNRSRGIIELNVSNTQLSALVDSSDSFTDPLNPDLAGELSFYIISAEQLLIERQGALTNYRTRYGDVYTGEDDEVLLIRLVSDGNIYQLSEISPQEYISSSGSAILQDSTGQYDDSTVLALSYEINPNLLEYAQAQQNRYVPDTFQLYYHAGLIASEGSTSDIRAFVEQNEASWYNQKSSTAQFYPVNRGVSTYVSYITEAEANNFTEIASFNPNETFRIVDTLSLKNLSDVYGPGGAAEFDDFYGNSPAGADDTILKFDSGTGRFVAIKHRLDELNNVDVSGGVTGQVLTLVSGTWVPRAISGSGGILGYTALNKAGDIVDAGGRLRYTSTLSFSSNPDGNILTTVGYVDEAIADHDRVENAHGATSAVTDGKIIRRATDGTAQVANPGTAADSSQNIATANWVNAVAATSGPSAYRIAKRDSMGRLEAADPSTDLRQSNANYDLVTANWIYDWSSFSNPYNHLIRGDDNGNAYVSSPIAGGHIANKSYVDGKISEVATSFGSNWAAFGNIYLGWVEDFGVGTTDGFVVVGPVLPAGTYSMLTGWVTSQANNSALTSQITMNQNSLYVDSNRRPRMTISIEDIRGGSAWGSRAHWVVRKNS